MSILIVLAAAAVAAAEPAAPPAVQPPAAQPIVRAGDGQMSCEALLAEVNALNAQVMAQQTKSMEMAGEMAQSQRGLMGGPVASTLAGMASSYIPGLSTANSLARAAQAQALQMKMASQIEKTQAEVAALLPTYQRLDHLTGLVHQKGC